MVSSESLNIVLFGETGVGKSSVINLIAGKRVAEISSNASVCTLSCKPYIFDNVGGRTIHIWDTSGLNQAETGPNSYLVTFEQAQDLLQQLAQGGGVDVLLFCMNGGRTTATAQKIYNLFYEVFFGSQVPIAAVVTNLEREPSMEGWWSKNAGHLEKSGLKFMDHACVTGLQGHSKYLESQDSIRRLLAGLHSDQRFTVPLEGWLVESLGSSSSVSPQKKEGKGKDNFVKALWKRCGFD